MSEKNQDTQNHELNDLIDKIEYIAYQKYNSDSYNNINSIFNMLTDIEKVLFLKYAYKIITSMMFIMDMTDMQDVFISSSNNKRKTLSYTKNKIMADTSFHENKVPTVSNNNEQDMSGPISVFETAEDLDKRRFVDRKHRFIDNISIGIVVLLMFITIIALSSSGTVRVFKSTANFFSTVFGL